VAHAASGRAIVDAIVDRTDVTVPDFMNEVTRAIGARLAHREGES
jgi:hypothetical protein